MKTKIHMILFPLIAAVTLSVQPSYGGISSSGVSLNDVSNIVVSTGGSIRSTVFDFPAPVLTNMIGWRDHIGFYATNYVATNGNDSTAVPNDPTHPWKDPFNAQQSSLTGGSVTNFTVVKLGDGYFTNSVTPESESIAFIGNGPDKTFIQATNSIHGQEGAIVGATMVPNNNCYYANITFLSTSNSVGNVGPDGSRAGQAFLAPGDDSGNATNVVFNNVVVVGYQDGLYLGVHVDFDAYNLIVTNYYDAIFGNDPSPQSWRLYNCNLVGVLSPSFGSPRLTGLSCGSSTAVEYWGGFVKEQTFTPSVTAGISVGTNSFVVGTILNVNPNGGIGAIGGGIGYWNADGTNFSRFKGSSDLKNLYLGYLSGSGASLTNITSPSSLSLKPVAVTVGASVFGYTNVTSDVLQVWVSGGTGSMTVNGVAVFGLLTGNENFLLPPTNQIKITYTLAPSMFTNKYQFQTR